MKNILHFLILVLSSTIVISCSLNKNFVATGTNEEVVLNATQVLKKHPANEAAKNQLSINYKESEQKHAQLIDQLKSSSDSNRWENVIAELTVLQDLYSAVNTLSPAITAGIPLKNYSAAIQVAEDSMAEENYRYAICFLNRSGRENARAAYNSFKKAAQYTTNYKESASRRKEIFDLNTVNIVITPLETAPSRSTTKKILNGNGEDMEKRLVKDLGADLYKLDADIPARFYTDEEAKEKNIAVDWVIHFNLKDVSSIPKDFLFSDEVTNEIEVGKDTSGLPFYKRLYAKINIVDRVYTVSANMEYSITNVLTNTIIEKDELPVSYSWEDKFATYTGDYRALDPYDWELVNNNGNNKSYLEASRMISELCSRVYSDIKEQIVYVVKW